VWFPAQGYLFALGMVLAAISVAGDSALNRAAHRIARPAAVCWGVGIGALLLVVFAIRPSGFERTVGQQLAQRGLYALAAVAVILPGIFGGETGLTRRLLASGPLRSLGLVSYGIFLWHLDLLKVFEKQHLFRPPVNDARFLLVLLVTSATAVAAAVVTWAAIERPVQRMGRRSKMPAADVASCSR
jgi:peptidoglycan/LPS O-acetylase OafA/YrhL